jgi:hypothetical protein
MDNSVLVEPMCTALVGMYDPFHSIRPPRQPRVFIYGMCLRVN